MGASKSEVELIPVLRDNYVVVLHDGAQAVVVDPGVAGPVITWLERCGLELVAVLQTHHHWDHIDGTPGLLRRWPDAAVMAAGADRARIPFQTLALEDGDRLELLGRRVQVLAVPGHTRWHLAFYLPPTEGGRGELFCGDTLFAAGCGRLFEGSPEEMHQSLQRLGALPGDTRVWCAHEYTLSNLRWAAASCPEAGEERRAIQERLAEVEELRRLHQPTIPSTIAREWSTNLMLRASDANEFASRRRSKDHWQG
ncbi:hydroxyacylglutathione hydrolase [Synechococcus sp. BA-124 BA4]|uniref:hydroxyacylglutathione hydrolase n=1 Tax=unclassified Synechococcus TaxID=2626047 RepID=UPI0018CE7376|nr:MULTISPECIES: hydroxyacylglutathione hydrolase [unclassified Synechococcus]MEA5399716.1 hydroxyacylglutathione hydrolase [Synechococcus sp. BA-124 BA4]QPN56644.1 hydroxyacylglutathione hydrolase [Synechococcus sp. CBW1107]CAK6695548.1 Hydroxyacylglutathione hydrolase [Synechococcus sp. CBW1107]